MRSTSYKISLAILTKWLVPHYLIDNKVREEILNWIIFYDRWLSRIYINNGLKEMISHSKTCRLLVLRYISGDPLFSTETRLRILNDGLPFPVKKIRRLLYTKDPKILRIVLTVLNLTKSIDDESLPLDIKPIVSKWNISDPSQVDEIMKMIPAYLSANQNLSSFTVEHIHEAYHFSAKSSPNGGPALGAALSELTLLFKAEELTDAIIALGGKGLTTDLALILKFWDESLTLKNVTTLRKLFVVQDKEAKSRIVAILDYWSQTALKRLHDSLFLLLRKFESDMTHDQSSFTEYINKYKPKEFWCYDLSNATDRFPIRFQKEVLTYFIGEVQATAWCTILTGLPFKYYDEKKDRYLEVKYEVGQPMGANSSWPAFTLSHHVLVGIAAKKCGRPIKGSYILLGDDIVIFDKLIAETYLKFMTILGVEISLTKSICSKDLCSFAARYLYKGTEISPFSLKGLHESYKSAAELSELFKTMRRNGWTDNELDMTPGSLLKLIDVCSISPFFRKRKVAEHTYFLLNFSIREMLATGLVPQPVANTIDCHSASRAGQKLISVLHSVFLDDLTNSTLKKVKLITAWIDPDVNRFFGTEMINLDPKVRQGVISLLPHSRVRIRIVDEFTKAYARLMSPVHERFPFSWEHLSNYRSLNLVPDVKVALKKRNHLAAVHSQSSLLIKSIHVCTTQECINYLSNRPTKS